jgi:hypothetical protein
LLHELTTPAYKFTLSFFLAGFLLYLHFHYAENEPTERARAQVDLRFSHTHVQLLPISNSATGFLGAYDCTLENTKMIGKEFSVKCFEIESVKLSFSMTF